MKMVDGSTVRHGRVDCSYHERVSESRNQTGAEVEMQKRAGKIEKMAKKRMEETREGDKRSEKKVK